MPLYVKFLKEILTNKRMLDEDETMALTEECNSITQNKFPSKLKDPWRLLIPCVISRKIIDKALCNL